MMQANRSSYLVSQPYLLLFLLWLLSFLSKLVIIFSFTGILHPDAIYQSLEIAHSWVYGYGVIPPEFQFRASDPYSMSRSPIFPAIFYPFFYLGNLFSLPYRQVVLPSIYVFLALNASLMTPAVFFFVDELFQKKNPNLSLFVTIITLIHWIPNHYPLHALTNSFFTPYLLFFFTSYLKHLREHHGKPAFFQHYAVPFLSAIIMYIRVDLLIPFAFLLFLHGFFLTKTKTLTQASFLLVNLIGVLSGFFFAGLIDYWYYGIFFVSPIHWFTFNIILGGSKIFGVMPVYYYFLYFFLFNPSSLIALVIGMYHLYAWKPQNLVLTDMETLKYLVKLETFLVWVLSFLVYSTLGHKELRFLYQGQVFFLIFMMLVYWDIVLVLTEMCQKRNCSIHGLQQFFNHRFQPSTRSMLTVFLLFLLLIESIGFASLSGVITKRREMIAGYTYIGEQPDVIGVIHVGNIYTSPGYTYLHQDVPLLGFNDLRDPQQQLELKLALNDTNTYNYAFLSTTYLNWRLQTSNLTIHDFIQWITSAGYKLVYVYKDSGYVWKYSPL